MATERTPYQRRNDRAKAAGFSSYGQQRTARQRGYTTAADFLAAKAASATLGTRAVLPATVVVRQAAGRTFLGESNLTTLPGRSFGRDVADAMRAVAGPGGRVEIAVGGQPVMQGRGYTVDYFDQLLDQYDGDLEALAEDAGYDDPNSTGVTVSV